MPAAAHLPRGQIMLFAYFAGLIAAGTLLLLLPFSWAGPTPLGPVDALFTATSAVTVTGLGTVDTAQFSRFGQVVVMLLIQTGGLGVVVIVVFLLMARNAPVSVYQRSLIGSYFLPSVENRPRRIIAKVLAYAAAIELAGILALWPAFAAAGVPDSLFAAAFHAVSAFCNAGFSCFSTNLESFAGQPAATAPIALLVIAGGLGFVVFDDLRHRILGDSRRLRSHTAMVLIVTAILLAAGTLGFWLLESRHALARWADAPAIQVWESFFMAVVPRTAGFDTIPPASLGAPAQLLTAGLMFAGGAPSSTAGGLKITTVAILVLLVWRGLDTSGDLSVGRRRIPAEVVGRSAVLFVRAALLLGLLVFLLCATQYRDGAMRFPVFSLIFESISAFCTVGLSLGVTPGLDAAGKAVVIATMFLGRVGLIALALPRRRRDQTLAARLPAGEVLIG